MSEQTPSQDPFELLKRMWAPMGLPMPGMVAPLLDIAEIDKRIADLRSVENWLNVNLNVLRMTIQGLEMQKSTLAAFRAMQPGAGSAAGTAEPPEVASAADAWWTLLQQTRQSAAPETDDDKKRK